ncbi:Signal peptidase, peptidase S26 [Bartonella sp. CDC_skunk]|nr:Signal peptidase, peptidase S26 [Bartonella sp. CDC_skunk]AQX26183.1 Signal peptidase, peptidase S26 [Bartonella sp. Raccoon60]
MCLLSRCSLTKGYLRSGVCPSGSISFLKPLVAIAGDVVHVTEKGVSVNGSLLKNSQKKEGLSSLPKGKYRVQEGYAWFFQVLIQLVLIAVILVRFQ